VVTGCDDLSIGGEIHDPDQEAIDLKRPGLPKVRVVFPAKIQTAGVRHEQTE